jgi:hypothetical protein
MMRAAVHARRASRLLSCAAVVAVLFGCASAPEPLYQWGSYQSQVYAYLKGDGDIGDQYAALQKQLAETQSKGKQVPPGFFAHMALLEMNQGQNDLALKHLQTEKSLFPESAPFVDWLLTHRDAAANKS